MKKSPSSVIRRTALGLSFLALAAGAAQAASPSVWNGGGTDSLWSNAANWSGNVPVPGPAYALQFGGTANVNTDNDFAAGSSFASLTFNAASGLFVLNGNAITLAGNITVTAQSSNGFNAPKVINLDIASTATTLAISVPELYNNGLGKLPVAGLTINGVISGSNNLSKTNNGTLVLGGANTYTGITTLSAGAVSVSSINNGGVAGGLGAATNAATNLVFDGGFLRYTGATASTDRNFTITAGKTATFDIVNSATNLTWSGKSTATTGIILKQGLGTLTLTGNGGAGMLNTGITQVHGGSLVLDFTAAGAPASNILSSGSELSFGRNNSVTGVGLPAGSAAVTIKGNVTSGTSVLQTFGTLTTPQGGNMGHVNVVNTGSGGNIQVTFNNLSTNVGGMADFSKGAGDVIHFNTAPSVNSGAAAAQSTLASSGTAGVGYTLNGTDWATIDGSNNIVATTYATDFTTGNRVVDVTSSGLTMANSEIALRFNTNIGASNTVTVSGTRPLSGILVTNNVGANGVTVTGGTLGASGRTFAVFQNNTSGDLTINSVISANAAVGLAKAGAGRLILGGNNTMSGPIFINEGTLQISNNNNLGLAVNSAGLTNYAAIVVGLNGTLEARGGSTITLDGLGTQSGIYARNIQLGIANSTIDVDAGTTLAVTGGINGAQTAATINGSLTKTGAGQLTLSGVNYSAGGLVVDGGTVLASGVGASASATTFTPQGILINLTTTGTNNTATFATTSSNTKNLQVGQMIAGNGIAPGSVITAITVTSPTLITLTLDKTTTANGVNGSAIFMNAPTTATFGSGVTSLTVANAANIQVGQEIYGTGIAAGTVVTSVSGTTIGINQATTGANDANPYAFGGANQAIASTTANLGLGEGMPGSGFNGYITGIQGNIVTTYGINNGNLTSGLTTNGLPAWDSLGTGTVTVKSGTLDLGGLSHTTQTLPGVIINGGTIQNGTLASTSYTADVTAGTATVSANLSGTGAALSKSGAGTVVLSGANTYTAGTTISTGTLLANNTTGSGTGTGALSVSSGAKLGGTGIIAPTGANGLAVSGKIAPGASIGTLTVNLGSTTGKVTMGSGSSFEFELGTANASIGSIAAGSSDLLAITGASSGDFTFNLNNVDFLGTGQEGYYKLFSTSSGNANTWSGLTFDGTTGIVSAGLSYSNLASGLSGNFVVGTLSNGGTVGDIYFAAVPEPKVTAAVILLGVVFAIMRRRRQAAMS